MYNKKAIKCYEEGRVFQQNGRLPDAERLYKKAIKINQNFIEAHNDLGNVLLDRGRPKEAFNSFRKALTLRPGHPMLLTNIGSSLQSQGEFEKAITWFNKAISEDPEFFGAYINLGNALRDQGRFREAVDAYRHTIEINPEFADGYNNLGGLLIELDELDEAIKNLTKAVEIDPGHIEAYNGLGNALGYLGKIDEATAAYRKAIEVNPAHKDAYNGLGNMLSDMGEIDEAIESYRKAISINPRNADVYRSLSKIKKFSEIDDDIRTMEDLYAIEDIPEMQKMHLCFGLGKAYEDIGEYEKSMEFILQGTRLKRASYEYSISEAEDLFSRIKTVFSTDFFDECKGMGNPDQTPVFILGMPRSGTSLVEQILSSHPQVYGAGELNDLLDLTKNIPGADSSIEFPESIVNLDSEALENLGAEYINRLRDHSGEARFITDKMPPNFLHIGLIKAILPNARIIHCTRDPMDNCLSIFKNYFSKGHAYSYDMTELGQYYNLYRNLVEHWQKTLPGYIYDVGYEEMVADQENQIRLLIENCNLPWDDACLDFHKTRRKVRTASNAQVRRPIYKDSVKLWKRYEKQLQPLLATINV